MFLGILGRRALAVAAVAAFLLAGCAGLIPTAKDYSLRLQPNVPEGRGDYFFDYEDSTFVFSKEGVLVKVKHVTDAELNARIPPPPDGRHVNPYTRAEADPQKGYIPPRFTVFEVTVENLTYAKVEFDPARAMLVLDGGREMRYYDAGREGANPLGGNSFSKYYKTELGISGNEKELNLERMGWVYKTIYHRDRPVFREQERRGLLVFDPLPSGTESVDLRIQDFVLSFDASGNPEDTVDIQFSFDVQERITALAPEGSG